MIITWHKEGAIKIQDKERLVALNPHDDMSKFSCDVALLTQKGKGADVLREQPFTISSAGEYETKDVFVYGVPAIGDGGEKIVIYAVEMENIMIGYLGDLMQDQLTTEQVEVLEGVDVLCIPVGGDTSLNAKQAVKIINQIEPRIVIPISYSVGKGKQDGIEVFLKEYGVTSKHEKVDKLKLTKKDLPQGDTKVVVVEPS